MNKACTHCGSKSHGDFGCWKRLTCQKCGRKEHTSDKCLHVCAACGEIHDCGKRPMEEFYNLIRKWYVPSKHAGIVPPKVEEIFSLGRLPGLNLVRDDRSRLFIYAFVERQKRDQEFNDPIADTGGVSTFVSSISSVKRVDEYTRYPMKMKIDLAPGESRGYWKYHTPGKCSKQDKAVGKINNEKTTMLFDSGADISIVATTFARKVRCVIDESRTQE